MMGKLHTKLMPSTCLRTHFQQAQAPITSPLLVVQKRLPSAGCTGFHDFHSARVFVLPEPILQAPRRLPGPTLNHRPVHFINRALPKLPGQSGGGLAGAREKKHPGDRPVEPMNNAQEDITRLVMLVFQVLFHLPVDGLVTPLKVRTDPTRRLGNGQAMVVFVQDLKGRNRHGFSSWRCVAARQAASGYPPRTAPSGYNYLTMANSVWDVVVIGAGAAGLLAATRAAERGRHTLLLEKNRRPGVKILMSGGTRCNLTHSTDDRGIVEAFGPAGRFLHSPLASLSVQDTIDLFESEGVATKVEETGKVFPVSNRAADVLDALLRRLERSGAVLALGEPVLGIEKIDPGFTITTAARAVSAGRVILTSGGQSYPGSGTTGDGYAFAARLSHTIIPPRPALAPLTTSAPWVPTLRGVTVADAAVRIMEGGRLLASRRGSLLFAHFGLSGPVVLDVSRVVSGHERPGELHVEIDLLPTTTEADLDDELRREATTSGRKQLAGVLAHHLPRRLAETILTLAGLSMDRKAAALPRSDRAKLVERVKHLEVPVTGTLGFKKAEVTAGGVNLAEVDSRTMQSKRVPGLYIAGEVLDLDGPIGGYNFQAAFSTGWLAGESV